jgi:two-component system LytT family response regulator
MSIRAIIADDEELARHILREYLARQPDIEVVGECDNGFAAVKAIAELKPDLLFLDVQMPKLDGFEVLELVDANLAVVFVTAYDQYATKAFDAAAVDYLLKPFDLTRFQMALDRVRSRLASPAVTAIRAAELRTAAQPPGRYVERVVIRDGARVHVLPVAQIEYVEAQGDYLAFHSGGKCFLKQQTIASLEQSLDPKQFVRVHRSFVVNLERLSKIEAYTKDARLAILADGAKIPVSRSGYLKLKEAMAEP